MSTQKPSDFVQVQLSAAGGALAPVHIANGHFSYVFANAAVQQRVLTSEWTRVLSLEKHNGQAIFEIAPATAPAPATATASASTSTATSATKSASPVTAPVEPPGKQAKPAAGNKKQADEELLKELQAEAAQLQTEIAQEGN